MDVAESLLVEVTRGDMVESRHLCAGVAVDGNGKVMKTWGDGDMTVYPRSAVKPFQALPLVETGAADAFDVSERELALACASHNGEAVHTEAVAAWLDRLGLADDDLECGPHRPIDPAAQDGLAQDGRTPRRVHNNCSGKHTGFLATALHMGEPTAGYIRPGHPVQERVIAAVQDLTGADLARAPRGTDGCGIPVIGAPLSGLARAAARFADPDTLAPDRGAAANRLLDAMAANPYLVAGRDRMDSEAMAALDGVVLKGGAEGVHVAVVRERGLGLAVKALDGASRAAETATLWALRYLGVIGEGAARTLAARLEPPIHNTLGETVGGVRAREVPADRAYG